MSAAGYAPKKRYKIKYKNVALLLAVLLLLILLISRGCSAIFSKDKENDELKSPLTTQDQNENPPDENGISMTDDPTLQTSYLFDSVKRVPTDLGIGDLVLVNNKIKFLGNVAEDDLVVVREQKNDHYWVKDYTVMVRPQVMDALNDMIEDFYNATGNDTLLVRAGHRTLEYQQQLYDQDLEDTGLDYSSFVALPGFSEHHTGLAVDFAIYNGSTTSEFDGTGDFKWIMDNCYKYGFINRYPTGKESLTFIDNEPWHFRYVGVAHATAMHNLDYCLEEYIDFLRNYTIASKFYSVTTDDGSQYIIYYTPMSKGEYTDIYLPQDPNNNNEFYPYSISGNNVDGWVVCFRYKEGAGIRLPAAEPQPEVTTAPEEDTSETTTAAE